MMNAEHFTAVYAARWEVELLFRELKSNYHIEHMPSAAGEDIQKIIAATAD